MDPVTAAALGQLGGSVVGEVLGNRGDAAAARRRALAILQAVNAETGPIAPEERAAMAQAVDYLRGLYEQGGLDPQAKAALQEAETANAARERMDRQAITQGAATRGVGGSGVEIAAQLASQQGAANRNAATGTRAAADARTRAIQALLGSSNIAGNIRGQDSAIASFNAAQRLRKAGLMAGAETGNAGAAEENANRSRFDYGQLGGALGTVLSGRSSKLRPEDENPELLYGG